MQDYHLPGQGPKRNNYPNSVALGTAKVLKVAIPERLAHQAPVPEIGLHQQNVTLFIILVTSSSSGSRDRRRYRTDMTTGRPWSGKISRLRKDSLPLNSRIGIRSICSNRTGMEIGGRESLCIPDIRRFWKRFRRISGGRIRGRLCIWPWSIRKIRHSYRMILSNCRVTSLSSINKIDHFYYLLL